MLKIKVTIVNNIYYICSKFQFLTFQSKIICNPQTKTIQYVFSPGGEGTGPLVIFESSDFKVWYPKTSDFKVPMPLVLVPRHALQIHCGVRIAQLTNLQGLWGVCETVSMNNTRQSNEQTKEDMSPTEFLRSIYQKPCIR